jgi:hypothetical protein
MKRIQRKGRNTKQNLALVLLITVASLAIAGCKNSIGPAAAGSNGNAANTGNLSLTIPSTASWLSAMQSKGTGNDANAKAQSPSQSQARALAHATSVIVDILKSDGTTPVMDPVTVSLGNWWLGSTPSTTLQLIPVGTNYTVKISVYSSYTSSMVPVVTGIATGVDIVENATTSLTIKCLPYSPENLTLGTSVSPTLATSAEIWYSLTVTSGTTYYITQSNSDCEVGIFDGTGTYLNSNGSFLAYAATYSGTLYLVVVNSGINSSAASTLTVNTTAPVLNEGSIGSPVSLALNSAHAFKAGPLGTQDRSYYALTTSSSGTYALETGNSYFDAILFSDAGFTTSISTAYDLNYGTVFAGLSASTTYYLLLVSNSYSNSMSMSGQIVDSATISAASVDAEGSVASPVPLTVDSSWAGKVGAHVYNWASYYKITTGAGLDYSLSLSSISPFPSAWVAARVYSDSAFSTSIGYCEAYQISETSSSLTLAPSTTYYVKVANSPLNSSLTYHLKVSASSVPTFAALLADGTWTSGTMSTGSTALWYEATVVGGQSYTLYWDAAYEGSGSYNLPIWVSMYQSDRSTAFFTNGEYGYATGVTVTVPAGQTTIYIKVAPHYYTATGTFALKLVQN